MIHAFPGLERHGQARPVVVVPGLDRLPGWLADPTHRHELRYWDGAGWTARVSDDGVEGTDPLETPVA